MQIDFNAFEINNLHPTNVFEKEVIDFLNEWFSPSATLFAKTSGSTGSPKRVEVEKAKMQNSAILTLNFLELKNQDTALLCLPMENISGKMMIVRSIERKMRLLVTQKSLKPLENLNQPIDFCAMTPLQVANSLDKIHLIKKLIIGGGEVSQYLKSLIKAQLSERETSTQVYETYGMTETLSHIALKEIYPNSEEYFQAFKAVELGLDERGALKILAPHLHPEWIITNDLVELQDAGKFRFLGRIDHIINSGGAKIVPEELESFAKTVITNEIVFLGIPDEVLGQKLVAIIETPKDEDETEKVQLRKQIDDLPFEKSFHRPKEIFFVNEIPRTSNGKIDRRTLLDLIIK